MAKQVPPSPSDVACAPAASAADIPLEVVYGIIFPFVDAPFSCAPVSLVNTRTYQSAHRCLGRHQKFGSRRWCEQQFPQEYRLISHLQEEKRPRTSRQHAFPYGEDDDGEDNVFFYHFPVEKKLPANVLDFAREVFSKTVFDVPSTCCSGTGLCIVRRSAPALAQEVAENSDNDVTFLKRSASIARAALRRS